MSSMTSPRGPLPARVYWIRRAIVLGVALLLIVGIARLIGGLGSDPQAASSEKAAVAGARTSQKPAVQGPSAVATRAAKTASAAPAPADLATPDGACLPSEVGVTPTIKKAFAGRPIGLTLSLESTRAACTFKVSPQKLVARVSSGSDAIWSTQQCPKAVPTREVVVRSAKPATISLAWSGQRSDEECSQSADWARPGFYHLVAAAVGSEPTDVQFELVTPPRPVVTRTAKPSPTPSKKATTKKPTPKPTSTPRPTRSPSGAVEPDQTSG